MKAKLPEPGDLVGGSYQLERVIGRGGWAVVYEALQLRMRRKVAIKVLLPDFAEKDLMLKRFEQEAMLATHLRHPNIIELYDTGRSHQGLPYIVMELLSGVTAKKLVKGHPHGLSTARTVRIMRQVLQGLAEAHEQGVLHRDIKPSNVFLCDFSNAEDFVKILDFGIAKIFDSPDSHLPGIDTVQLGGGIVGSPRYMAPESFKDEPATPSTDLFSVGLVMAELLGGRPVLDGDTEIEVIGRLCAEEELSLAPAVQQSPLFPLISRALRKDVSRRYQSAGAMLAALDAQVAEGVAPAPGADLDVGATVKLDGRSASEQLEELLDEEAATEAFDTAAAIRAHEAEEAAGRSSNRHGGPGVSHDNLQSSVPGRTRNMGRGGRRQAQSEAMERVPPDRAPTQRVIVRPPPPPKRSTSTVFVVIGLVVGFIIVLALCGALGGVLWLTTGDSSAEVQEVSVKPTSVSAEPSPSEEPPTYLDPPEPVEAPTEVAASAEGVEVEGDSEVEVNSTPSGALVMVEGSMVGTTPLVLDLSTIEAGDDGELQVAIRLKGYKEHKFDLDPGAEAPEDVAVSLQRQPTGGAAPQARPPGDGADSDRKVQRRRRRRKGKPLIPKLD